MGGVNHFLDFGCGNGGFLKELKKRNIASHLVGVELDKEARNYLLSENIEVYKNLENIDEIIKFDVITMFHVIEHLENPQKVVCEIRNRLAEDGLLIIETPNSEDALISKYHSKNFMDFTFWSAHLFLYNSDSLEMLMEECGFSTVDNGQIQRYPLSNHLYWLVENKPGGHMKWQECNSDLLNVAYADILKSMRKCDTLFGIFKKNSR